MHFEDLSNEVILCICDHLLDIEVIFSFSNINNRLNSLLYKYCGLYTKLDLRYSPLSMCHYFCKQVLNVFEWRVNLNILKLGNHYRCCQLDMFTNEIIRLFMLEKEEKQSNNISHSLIKDNKYLQPLFPHLISIVIVQTTYMSNNCRDILLYVVSSGSTMRRFIWNTCDKQSYHSKAFFDWLFQCSRDLHSFQLTTRGIATCFELTYDHTLINNYISHHSLINLHISIVDFLTLNILLHYLPQLQHLNVHFQSSILLTDITNNLLTILNFPKNLRTLKFRNLKIKGRAVIVIENFVEKFQNTLEEFALCIFHICNDDFNFCFDGHRLSNLCSKLIQLQKLSFSFKIKLIEKANENLISKFTRSFCTPFWCFGPLGCLQVGVDYHSKWNIIQIFSLPYIFSQVGLVHTIDLLNIKFNIDQANIRQISIDPSISFQPLWLNMRRLVLSFYDKQLIPLTFLLALQSPFNHYQKTLILVSERGILPNNVENHLQLVQFTKLFLSVSDNNNFNFDIQNFISWLRLLPNVDCVGLELTEFKYWFMNDSIIEDLHFFLQRLNRLILDCSYIINKEINEEFMEPLLLFILNRNYFSKLQCLQLICKNISSSWKNIDQWIYFILHRINEHRLTYFRFDFIEKKEEITTNFETGDEIIMNNEYPYIIHIHRFISTHNFCFWIEKKEK